MVGAGALQSAGDTCNTAEYIAAANHQAQFGPLIEDPLDLNGNALHGAGLEAKLLASHEAFARNFQEYAPIKWVICHEESGSIMCRATIQVLPSIVAKPNPGNDRRTV